MTMNKRFLAVAFSLVGMLSFSHGDVVHCGNYDTECPAGCYSETPHWKQQKIQNSCIVAGPGYASGHFDDFLVGCGPGQYSDTHLAGVCKRCPPGSHSTETINTECKLCPRGTYQRSWGTWWCLPCDDTYWPYPGADQRYITDDGIILCDHEDRPLSENPSDVPSFSPTQAPSVSPTASPSRSSVPSIEPSGAPSAPTVAPSGRPTSDPTNVPSLSPSVVPSNVPSEAVSSLVASGNAGKAARITSAFLFVLLGSVGFLYALRRFTLRGGGGSSDKAKASSGENFEEMSTEGAYELTGLQMDEEAGYSLEEQIAYGHFDPRRTEDDSRMDYDADDDDDTVGFDTISLNDSEGRDGIEVATPDNTLPPSAWGIRHGHWNQNPYPESDCYPPRYP